VTFKIIVTSTIVTKIIVTSKLLSQDDICDIFITFSDEY